MIRRAFVAILLVSLLGSSLLISPSSPARAQGIPLPVVFWSAYGPVSVPRTLSAGPHALLTALLAGPSAAERIQGLWSAIPAGTTLAGITLSPDRAIVVRLAAPPESLAALDVDAHEAIVQQIGLTLEPLRWRDLQVQTWDANRAAFVPLIDLAPPVPSFSKETVRSGEETPSASTVAGQPPAPGQGQPQGALSGRTVYVSAGHGWLWNDTLNGWRTQRPPYPNPPYVGPFIEDHNNAEAVNQYLLQYLWNAGALVFPARERDMNADEVIVDDDAPTGYAESGTWTTTSGTGYDGGSYRWTYAVSGTATATATWTTDPPADGQYAVYAWYYPGANRAPDARYVVHHAGGTTTVVVDQRHHGLTWHYLGSYGFRADQPAWVELTNQSSSAGTMVIADAVRFGGGTFDSLYGIETVAPYPTYTPWWEVAAYYYTQRMGMSAAYGDVVARPVYARWEHVGTGDDAVYVSWHTNGVSGYQWTARGTLSIIHNSEGSPITPGSVDLRNAIHAELLNDIRAAWDPTWPGAIRSMNLGELRELWNDDLQPGETQIPGALIEIAYHDHPTDADALKEPNFERLAARALYQGIVNYFAARDGLSPSYLPEPPTHLQAQNLGGGQVRLAWQASPTDDEGVLGDAASGYRVYTSADGVGWSNGVAATGGTAHTLGGLSAGQLLFVRVSATNAGGESFPTETLAVRVGDEPAVLLVNGFDRLNASMLIPDYYPYTAETHVRMFLERMNRYDYVVQHGAVISYPFDSASNEAVQTGTVDLGRYTVVDWILGEESTQDETLNEVEQGLLQGLLHGGGALFVSGAEVGWDLDDLGSAGDQAFYNTVLHADYTGDDGGSYEVAPVAGSIFEGLAHVRFDAAGMYDADYPDRIAPLGGATAALSYVGGAGGTAALQYANGCQRLVYFGFPFETIVPEQRAAVMGRMLGFLDECLPLPVNTTIASPLDGSAHAAVPSFGGTAAAADPLTRVEVQIERQADGLFWDGGAWVSGTNWLTATGLAAWSYGLPALAEGGYALRARGRTADAVDDSPAAVAFTYDTQPPAATVLITPTGGITIAALPGAALAWQPVADGGSPLAYTVQVDGQLYTTTQSTHTASPIGEGPHTWGVQVVDAAGNRSAWVTDSFVVERLEAYLPLIARAYEPPQSGCTDVVVNGGFETDSGWILGNNAVLDTTVVHSGARSARLGILPSEPGPTDEDGLYSSVRQSTTLLVGSSARLQLWVEPFGEALDTGDYHYIVLLDQWDGYHLLDKWRSNSQTWELREYDLTEYLGQDVTVYIGVYNDADDDTAVLYVDDVVVEVCP